MKKVYVITGSTSGIGKTLVEHYSKDNIVFAGYRNIDLKPEMENVIPFYIDYAKPKTIQSAVDEILSKNLPIDTVINVAGCVVAGAMENISMNELRRQFDVNVFGAIELTRGVSPKKVLNISSMSSFGIFPFIAPYCASKRTLDILFNLYQIESKRDIDVVSIKLGSIATPIWRKSVNENQDALNNAENYKKECEFLVKNALDNEKNATPIEKATKAIINIDNLKKPKPSYTIGFDAKMTEIISHLPQSFINFVIKQKLKKLS